MKKFLNALLCVAVVIPAASCIMDSRVLEPDTPPGDKDVDIVLNLHTPGGFSAPRTRGLNYEQENKIAEIHVLVFDSESDILTAVRSGGEIKEFQGNEMTAPDTGKGISGSGSFMVTLPPSKGGRKSNLMVLANVGSFASTIAGFTLDATGYDDVLEALVVGGITGKLYPSDGTIPMWGETGAIPIAPATPVPAVKLMRAVARIDVGVGAVPTRDPATDDWTWDGTDDTDHTDDDEGNAIPFQLTSVHVMRSNNKYAVVPAPGNVNSIKTATAPTVPDDTDAFTAAYSDTHFGYSGTGNITSGLFTTRSIYVPEADTNVTPDGTPGDASHTERMAIVVGGKYKTDTDPTYYRLDFAKKNESKVLTLMDVLRNHLYQFNISSVSGRGYPDVITAYESQAMNMTVDILDWDEAEIGDIVFNGNYYFGISDREVTFDPLRGLEQRLKIKTNVPGFSLVLDTGYQFEDRVEEGPATLKIGGTIAHTGADFTYALAKSSMSGEQSEDGDDIYYLTITTRDSHVSSGHQPHHVDRWNILAGLMDEITLTVTQEWTSTYISVENGQSARIYPEGASGLTAIPIDIVSSVPVDVAVTSPSGGTGWIHGVANPTETGGIWTSKMNITVDPFKYGPANDGTVNRSAVITISPDEDGHARRYTITQEFPYLSVNPVDVRIDRPASLVNVTRAVQIQTNLLWDHLEFDFAPDAGDYISASDPVAAGIATRPRYRRFTATVDFESGTAPIVGFGAGFRVTPKTPEPDVIPDYGIAPATGVINVRSEDDVFAFYWRAAHFISDASWSDASEIDNTDLRYFPWNTTQADFDIVTNVGVVDYSTPGGLNGGRLSPGESSPAARPGESAIGFLFQFDNTVYTASRGYELEFVPEQSGDLITAPFTRGVQRWTRNSFPGNTSEGPVADAAVGYTGYPATNAGNTAKVTVTDNIEWSVLINGADPIIADRNDSWIEVHTVGNATFAAPDDDAEMSQNDRVTAPQISEAGLEKTSDLSIRIDAWNVLNPAGTGGTPLVNRRAQISFTNRDRESNGGTGISLSDHNIRVTQWAPRLDKVSHTLPTTVPAAATDDIPCTITASSNIAWEVRIYDAETGGTQVGSGTVTSPSVNPAAAPVESTVTSIDITSSNTGTIARTLHVYLVSTSPASTRTEEFLVGTITQPAPPNKIYAAPGQVGIKESDYNKLMSGELTLQDAKDGLYTLTLRGSSTYKADYIASYTGNRDYDYIEVIAEEFGTLENEPVYAVYFKWGSMVAMIGGTNDTWSKDDIVWVNKEFDLSIIDNPASGSGTASSYPYIGYGGFSAANHNTTNQDNDIMEAKTNGEGDICMELTGEEYKIPSGNPFRGDFGSNITWLPSTNAVDTGVGSDWSVSNTEHTIFLPAAGYRRDTDGRCYDIGITGYWWTSTAQSAATAYSMTNGARSPFTNQNSYSFGLAVRCVRK